MNEHAHIKDGMMIDGKERLTLLGKGDAPVEGHGSSFQARGQLIHRNALTVTGLRRRMRSNDLRQARRGFCDHSFVNV